MILPRVARLTLGLVAVAARRYIDWLEALHRYVALAGWTLVVWVSFQPLILTRQRSDASTGSKDAVNLIAKLFFAFFICAVVLLAEKFAIQWIAGKFHERSYAGTQLLLLVLPLRCSNSDSAQRGSQTSGSPSASCPPSTVTRQTSPDGQTRSKTDRRRSGCPWTPSGSSRRHSRA